MKKLILLSILAILSISANAQSFALVDMEYILNHIDNYTKANYELNQLSKKVQEQIDAVKKDAANLYRDYQKNLSTLTPEEKRKRQDAIMDKEKKAAEVKLNTLGHKEN